MEPTSRDLVLPKLLVAAVADRRIVGVVEYGSGCQGRADALSDLDIVLVIRDAVFDDFNRDWKTWVTGLG